MAARRSAPRTGGGSPGLGPRYVRRVARAQGVAVLLDLRACEAGVPDLRDDPAVALVLEHAALAGDLLAGLVGRPAGHVVALELVLPRGGKALQLDLHALGHEHQALQLALLDVPCEPHVVPGARVVRLEPDQAGEGAGEHDGGMGLVESS